VPLRTICFCTYLTSIGGWRQVDYDAHKFIYAIKDRVVMGYGNARIRGERHWFNNNNRQEVVGWFAQMVVDYLAAEQIDGQLSLVPVPGSKIDLAFMGQHRTAQLAEAIARALGKNAKVRDVLRWRKPMPSANKQGGTRDPARLLGELHLKGTVKGLRVVLVDDVMTTGGHLRACNARLRSAGADVILAVCAGRTDRNQVTDPFAVRQEDLDDFDA
jgi:hypothetical protein